MERIRQVKAELGSLQMDHIGEKIIKKREYELISLFTKVLDADKKQPKNAEVRYRYAHFLMQKKQYLNAILFFKQALKINENPECTFPIKEDQLMKAHLYIGYCAGQMLKESLVKANELNVEQAHMNYLNTEGLSLDEVLDKLKNQTEFYDAYVNGEKRTISLEEYLKYKAGQYGNVMLISFVENRVFIKVGSQLEGELPLGMGELLRTILINIIQKGIATYDDIREDFDQDWRTITRYMSRINSKVRDDGTGLRLLKLTQGTFENRYPQSLELAADNYMIVFRQSDFYEDGII
ncbi:hypothetical protein [Ureibacillus manganicus]|uniref:Uncharacterized protein n=1 Tax=Ureibacillus manganicus DSM 26584 TaxID=1384049 RepID=A0A0A3I8A2_9BACL|nr:hypothetical protein [Ureibacillus manganicus]KGR78968.1 hypothetical protein CD29_08080 [Ureibacillus manganicus DSM 26584]